MLPGLPNVVVNSLPRIQAPTTQIPNLPQLGAFYSNRNSFKPVVQKEETVDPYKDPDRLKSLADVFFNLRAQNAAWDELNNPWYSQVPILNSAVLFGKYFEDNYIRPAEGTNRIFNVLNSIGTDMDYFTGANVVKSFFNDGNIVDALGFGDNGIVNYNWDTGNFLTDLGLEIISDPVNLISLGAWGVTKTAASTATKAATETIEGVSEQAVKKLNKQITKQLINKTDDMGRVTENVTTSVSNFLKSQKGFADPLEVNRVLKTLVDDSSYTVLRYGMPIRQAVASYDEFVTKLAFGATPVGMAKYTYNNLKDPVLNSLHNKFVSRGKKYIDEVTGKINYEEIPITKEALKADADKLYKGIENRYPELFRALNRSMDDLQNIYMRTVSEVRDYIIKNNLIGLDVDAEITTRFLNKLKGMTKSNVLVDSTLLEEARKQVLKTTGFPAVDIPEQQLMKPILDDLKAVTTLYEIVDDTITNDITNQFAKVLTEYEFNNNFDRLIYIKDNFLDGRSLSEAKDFFTNKTLDSKSILKQYYEVLDMMGISRKNLRAVDKALEGLGPKALIDELQKPSSVMNVNTVRKTEAIIKRDFKRASTDYQKYTQELSKASEEANDTIEASFSSGSQFKTKEYVEVMKARDTAAETLTNTIDSLSEFSPEVSEQIFKELKQVMQTGILGDSFLNETAVESIDAMLDLISKQDDILGLDDVYMRTLADKIYDLSGTFEILTKQLDEIPKEYQMMIVQLSDVLREVTEKNIPAQLIKMADYQQTWYVKQQLLRANSNQILATIYSDEAASSLLARLSNENDTLTQSLRLIIQAAEMNKTTAVINGVETVIGNKTIARELDYILSSMKSTTNYASYRKAVMEGFTYVEDPAIKTILQNSMLDHINGYYNGTSANALLNSTAYDNLINRVMKDLEDTSVYKNFVSSKTEEALSTAIPHIVDNGGGYEVLEAGRKLGEFISYDEAAEFISNYSSDFFSHINTVDGTADFLAQTRNEVSLLLREYLEKQAAGHLPIFRLIDERTLKFADMLKQDMEDVVEVVAQSGRQDSEFLIQVYKDFMNALTGYNLADVEDTTMLRRLFTAEQLVSDATIESVDNSFTGLVKQQLRQIRDVNKSMANSEGLISRLDIPTELGTSNPYHLQLLTTGDYGYKKIFDRGIGIKYTDTLFPEYDALDFLTLNRNYHRFHTYAESLNNLDRLYPAQDLGKRMKLKATYGTRDMWRYILDDETHQLVSNADNITAKAIYNDYIERLPASDIFAIDSVLKATEATRGFYKSLSMTEVANRIMKGNSKLDKLMKLYRMEMPALLNRFSFDNSVANALRNTYASARNVPQISRTLVANDRIWKILMRDNMTPQQTNIVLDYLGIAKSELDRAIAETGKTAQDYLYGYIVKSKSAADIYAVDWAVYQIEDLKKEIDGIKSAYVPKNMAKELDKLGSITSIYDELAEAVPSNSPAQVEKYASLLERSPSTGFTNIVFREIEDDFTSMIDDTDTYLAYRQSIIKSIQSNVWGIRQLKPLNELRDMLPPRQMRAMFEETMFLAEEQFLNMTPNQVADYIRGWTPGYVIIDNTDKAFPNIEAALDKKALESVGLMLIKKEDSYMIVNTAEIDYSTVQKKFFGNAKAVRSPEARKTIAKMQNDLLDYANIPGMPLGEDSFIPKIFRHNMHQRNMSEWLPAGSKVAQKAYLNEAFFNTNDAILDFTFFGSLNKYFEYGDIFSADMTNVLQSNWYELIKRADSRVKFVELFTNGQFQLDNDMWNRLFDNMTDEQINNWFKDNNFKVAILNSRTKGNIIVPKIDNYVITSKEALRKAKALGGIVVPNETYSMMYRGVNRFQIDNKVLDFFHKAVIGAYKSSFLTSLGLLFRNGVDIIYKNTNQLGELVDIPEVLHNQKLAHDMLSFYNDIQADIISKFGNMSRRGTIQVLKEYPKELQEIYFFVNEFVNSPASSGMSKALQEFVEAYNFKGGTKSVTDMALENWNKYVVYNPVSKKISDINGMLEQSGRLGLVLGETSKGVDFGEAINNSIKAHFDYNTKRPVEIYAELFIPFVTFPLRNLSYYAEMAFNNPQLLKMLFDAQEISWNSNEQYSYADGEKSNFLSYQMASGNLRFGDLILKNNPSVFDSMNLILDPVGEVEQRLNPIAKSAIKAGQGDKEYDHITNITPFLYHKDRLLGIGKNISEGNIRPETIVPSTFARLNTYEPFKRYPSPYSFKRKTGGYVNAKWTKYPKITSRTFKNPARGLSFNRFYSAKSMYKYLYPKGNLSRVYLNSLPNSPAYYKDPKNIVSNVNRIKWMFR